MWGRAWNAARISYEKGRRVYRKEEGFFYFFSQKYTEELFVNTTSNYFVGIFVLVFQ